METNTLVAHKKLKTLGIGCISKVKSKSVVVNFGKYDTKTCNPASLSIIDTSNCKTITHAELRGKSITNGFKGGNNIFVLGNEVVQYVGISLITLRVVTHEDLKKYPRVIH